MQGRNRGKGLRFHPVATASQLPLTLRVNETTVNDGDLPMFRLLVETLADPRSAKSVLRDPTSLKKGVGIYLRLHAGQPVNADCAACGVAPELDELLDGEDTSQVLDRSAVLSMATLELGVSAGIPGDPSDMGNTDYVAVQVSFKNTGAASRASIT